MTALSKLLSFFPFFLLSLSVLCLLGIILASTWLIHLGAFFLLLIVLYLLPPAAHVLHNQFYPLREGISYLQDDTYNPWWGSHQIQLIYITFPALEGLLRLIPGAYSSWLRLWGAKIGRQVYWAPGVEIADRSLLRVGDRVIFGNQVGLYSHIIKPKRNNLLLYVKAVSIGENSFIGAWSKLGPGARVAADTTLDIGSYLYPNATQPSAHE